MPKTDDTDVQFAIAQRTALAPGMSADTVTDRELSQRTDMPHRRRGTLGAYKKGEKTNAK
jgi:hypothetical protein